jgi:hypothetical protein
MASSNPELANLMKKKTDVELQGMLNRPEDWSEDAISAAHAEVESRREHGVRVDNLEDIRNKREKRQLLPDQTDKALCRYCGSRITTWVPFGEKKMVEFDGIKLHQECARQFEIIRRQDNLANIFEQLSELNVFAVTNNVFFVYDSQFKSGSLRIEYVGIILFTTIGFIYIAQNMVSKEHEGGPTKSMSFAGMAAGGIVGGVVGAALDLMKDESARKLARTAVTHQVDLTAIRRELEFSVDSYLISPDDINSVSYRKGVISLDTKTGEFQFRVDERDLHSILDGINEFKATYTI